MSSQASCLVFCARDLHAQLACKQHHGTTTCPLGRSCTAVLASRCECLHNLTMSSRYHQRACNSCNSANMNTCCAVFAGLYPNTWPLPLSRQGLISAAQNPVHQPVPTGPVVIKKQPAYHGPENASAIKTEKVHTKTCQPDLMAASSAASIRSSKILIVRSAVLLIVSHVYPDCQLCFAVTAVWVTAAICYWC